MGKQKRVTKNYDFKTSGSGARPVPHGGDKNVGQPGVQGTPGILPVDRVPSGKTPQPNLAKLTDTNVSNAGTCPADMNSSRSDAGRRTA